MTTLLAGDIGGTKTVLRLIDAEPIATQTLPRLTTRFEQVYPSRDYPDLVPIVHQFLQDAQHSTHPEAACFGIAGPVVDNTCKLTNLSWFLSGDRLRQELHVKQVNLINDFVAVGYGVLGLSEADVQTLQVGEPSATAPIAVIGAGTGLGEGFSVPTADGNYQMFAAEGGHADFAPRSELEFQLLRYIQEKYSLSRVSVERVVSGMGIVPIYEFLRDRNAAEESPALAAAVRQWEREIGQDEKTVDLAAEISKAAIGGNDPLCEKAMQMFVSAYGAEAGNLALKLLPYGGLYIAGGIAPKILPLLKQGKFMESFLAKGRMTPVLEQVPVRVVLTKDVGLIGAALAAALLSR